MSNSCGFSIIHILHVPLASSHHQHLSDDNQPRTNLLKTTKATICKATDCISRGMVWLWLRLERSSPSALLVVWFSLPTISPCNSPHQPVHIQNIRVFMQAVVQVAEQSHKKNVSEQDFFLQSVVFYGLQHDQIITTVSLCCFVAKLYMVQSTFIIQIT